MMKNLVLVIALIMVSQVMLNAMPEPKIEYECKFVPVVFNSDSENVSREIIMNLICKPVQQKPPKFEEIEGESRSCCEIPDEIPIKDFRSKLKSR
jgi:hypothetical protein